jgi:hypothetical protein
MEPQISPLRFALSKNTFAQPEKEQQFSPQDGDCDTLKSINRACSPEKS